MKATLFVKQTKREPTSCSCETYCVNMVLNNNVFSLINITSLLKVVLKRFTVQIVSENIPGSVPHLLAMCSKELRREAVETGIILKDYLV